MRSSRGRIWLNVTPPPGRRTSRGDGPRPHRTAAAMAARRNSRTSVDAAFRHHLCGVAGKGRWPSSPRVASRRNSRTPRSRPPAPRFLALGGGGRCLAVRIDDQVSPRRHLGAPRSPAGAPKVTRSQCGGASTAGDARPSPLVGWTLHVRCPAGNSPVIAGRPPAGHPPCSMRSSVTGGCAGGLLRPLLIPKGEGSTWSESVQVRTPRRSRTGLSARLGRAGAGMRWSAGCWQWARRVVWDSGGDLLPLVLGHGRAGPGAGGRRDGVRVDLPGDHTLCGAAG